MTTTKSLRREPRESTQSSEQLFSSVLPRREAPADLSVEAKDHLTAVESIATGSLKDLKDVSNDIGKLRDEITLRSRMIAEATARLDELQRKAGTGYGTIRNAINMVREEYAAIPDPEPSIDTAADQKNGAATDQKNGAATVTDQKNGATTAT